MRGATVERSEYPSVYPEVVSECSVVWCPSVGCTDLRARSVSEYYEQQMFGQHGS